jgi:hypothetical protein
MLEVGTVGRTVQLICNVDAGADATGSHQLKLFILRP